MSGASSTAAPVIEHPPENTLDWVSNAASLHATEVDGVHWRSGELAGRVSLLASRLRSGLPARAVVGSLADNSPHWIVADLALRSAGMVHVPLPSFFTSGQIEHAIRASGMSGMFCSDASLAARHGFAVAAVHEAPLGCYARADGAQSASPDIPGTTAKITFTSGTTGTPKGVMLSFEQLMATASSLAAATEALGIERHLCLLPLPVLLENVAGAYTALLTGAACICPSLADAGMQGASGFDPRRCLDLVAREQADSIILLPQMLHALVAVLNAEPSRRTALRTLKFVAVGGARTPPSLIDRARRLGLPVYEGYGLSECASVVSLNLPGADRPGSVGRALPGIDIRLAIDGEIELRGRAFDGYLGMAPSSPDAWLATGDLGTVDEAGFLGIVGRKKHVLVTSYGRNVSPEWPESLVAEHPGILQSAVFGDARPYLVAVVFAPAQVPDSAIETHMASINARLPDYARLRAWTRASDPFTPANGLATPNGRMRRDAIHARYARDIAMLYVDAADDPMPEHSASASR